MLPADFRLHRRAAATLSWRPVDSEGEPATATGTPTVAVVDARGTAVTIAASPSIVSGAVNLAVTATETASMDRWTVTWSLDGVARGVSTVDIVGGVYLTVADIRALRPALSDAGTYSTATLQRCRREVEARFERAVPAVAFVPRFATYRFTGSGSYRELMPHYYVTAVRWARYREDGAWTTLSVTDALTDPSGGVELVDETFPWGRPCEVGYEHGLSGLPADVLEAAAHAVEVQALVSRSGIDSRATSFQPVEGGNVVLATPGLGPWEFGVPDIDGRLRSWRDRFPQVAVA